MTRAAAQLAKTITVGDIMSADPATVTENQGVLEPITLMRQSGVRRMRVDAGNRLVGIVTVDDLLGVLTSKLDHISRLVVLEQRRAQRPRA